MVLPRYTYTSAMLFWDFLFCFFFGVSFGTFVNESASRHIFLSDFFYVIFFSACMINAKWTKETRMKWTACMTHRGPRMNVLSISRSLSLLLSMPIKIHCSTIHISSLFPLLRFSSPVDWNHYSGRIWGVQRHICRIQNEITRGNRKRFCFLFSHFSSINFYLFILHHIYLLLLLLLPKFGSFR